MHIVEVPCVSVRENISSEDTEERSVALDLTSKHQKLARRALFCPIPENLFFFFRCTTAPNGPRLPHCRGFLITITLRHTSFGRIPLDEWSARRRGLYLTTHNTHNRQISMARQDSNPKPQQVMAADQHRGLRGHWDQLCQRTTKFKLHGTKLTFVHIRIND
jgi:hypothetical protein